MIRCSVSTKTTSLSDGVKSVSAALPGNTLPPASYLSFTSCYVYSPRAGGPIAEASRRICERVKRSDSVWLPAYAGFVYRTSLRDRQLRALFSGDATLIPVPGSAPCTDASWTSLHIAAALSEVGFALTVWTGLRRRLAVTKSATAPQSARPTVRQHYDSFCVTRPRGRVRKIVLVDDVITKGRTLLAAALRLQVELPPAEINAFALIRTLGFASHIDHLTEVCHGCVRWAGGDAWREP
jgi:predicted amidophosphoribosyltransferase